MSTTAYKFLIVSLVCFVSVHARNAPRYERETQQRVSGSVFCDRCLEKTFTFSTIGIPNVTVSIECTGFQATTSTLRFGFFKFDIPTGTSVNISTCSVNVKDDFSNVQGQLRTCSSPAAGFTVKSLPAPSSIPKPIRDGFPLYIVGPFVFQPAEALTICKNPPTPAAPPPFPLRFPPSQHGTGKPVPSPFTRHESPPLNSEAARHSPPCPPSRDPTRSPPTIPHGPNSKSVSAPPPGEQNPVTSTLP